MDIIFRIKEITEKKVENKTKKLLIKQIRLNKKKDIQKI
jgi:hypothetical protein